MRLERERENGKVGEGREVGTRRQREVRGEKRRKESEKKDSWKKWKKVIGRKRNH